MKSALVLSGILLIAAPAVHGERRGPISIAELEARTAERFAAIDADGDERISSDEFSAADVRPPRFMRRHHRSRGDGRRLNFDAIDADGDGSISRGEFDSARSAGLRDGKPKRKGSGSKPGKASMKESMFSRLDDDDDGFLSKAEFSRPIERLRALDANGDGQVDRGERRSGLRKRGSG